MMSTWDSEGRTVKVGGKTLVLRPLVYRRFKCFLASLPELFAEVAKENPGIDLEALQDRPLEALGLVGDKVLDRILGFIATSLFHAGEAEEQNPVNVEWLADNLQMAEFSDLLVMFFEENDVARVVRNFVKLGSVINEENSSPRPGSSRSLEESSRGPVPTTSSTN